jgi:NADH:ubiquinone oxidoreductase subunit C
MANEITLDALLAVIEGETGCQCEVYPGITNDETIIIPVEQLHAVIGVLREHFDCYHLSGITAQQRESRPGEIELIYHFWQGNGFSLLVRLPLPSPEVQSIISVIPGADFYEREVAEMYGVTFTGRSETPKLLLPEQWDQGPPFLRAEETDE